jgi:hypothetical protein
MTNNKQQTAVDRIVNLLNKEGFAPVLTEEEIKSFTEMDKEQSNAKINMAIKEFETLKSKANSLKDIVYLDGVLAVLDSIKNKTYGGGEQ